jgi:hypothetical protein
MSPMAHAAMAANLGSRLRFGEPMGPMSPMPLANTHGDDEALRGRIL